MRENWYEVAAGVASVGGFRNDLAAHVAGGIVHGGPEFFIMLRWVPSRAPVEQLVNPWWWWDEVDCDTWFIWLLAGDGAKALEMLVPVYGEKKFVAFQTRGHPKFWQFNKLSFLWPKVATTAKQSNSSGKA